MKRYLVLLMLLFLHVFANGQKQKADSMYQVLANEKVDSNKVNLMWKIADVSSIYEPERAMLLAREGLFLAQRIKYEEGQSRSLGIIANIFIKLGNYPRALEFNLQKLKLEEKRNRPRNLASVLMNIGIVYTLQEEYHQALTYYYRSDSVMQQHNVNDLKYNCALNLGDVYDRLNISDSAYYYFEKSLGLARELNDGDLIGTSMVGMGHTYLKEEKYFASLTNYKEGIAYLQAANDDELLCEATLGLATLYLRMNNNDSAVHYAGISLSIANKDGFLSKSLDASQFLSKYYQDIKIADSAFHYINYVSVLNDSINSKTRIRESQILSTNEQLRQLEIEESRRIAQRERKQQLQLLFIGIFIPGFFMITLVLSRIRVHIRLVKVLGILSLLILFEYLTLLLHPYVAELTHHTPVYEMLIFVSFAAILIPAHHRIEHWLIQKLINNRALNQDKKIKLKTVKLTKKT